MSDIPAAPLPHERHNLGEGDTNDRLIALEMAVKMLSQRLRDLDAKANVPVPEKPKGK